MLKADNACLELLTLWKEAKPDCLHPETQAKPNTRNCNSACQPVHTNSVSDYSRTRNCPQTGFWEVQERSRVCRRPKTDMLPPAP
jgi:hypothetical protein